jgi:hypothetical protein
MWASRSPIAEARRKRAIVEVGSKGARKGQDVVIGAQNAGHAGCDGHDP